MNFTATIERITSTRAIVTLFDASGEWAGASRVDLPRGATTGLYEAGYARASQAAALKGGRLDRFSEEDK